MQKIAAYIMLLASLLLPMQQASADIATAFSGLLAGANSSVNDPGYFKSQTQHVMSGGGMAMHFPSSTVQLISITPPSYSAGCSGISFQFGGFSFISGAELSKFVQQAAQGALGYVIFLAIKTLCPQCEAVLSAIQHMAQLAAKSAQDSCAVGKAVGTAISTELFGAPPAEGTKKAACASPVVDANGDSSYLSSIESGICSATSGLNDFFSKIDNWMAPNQQAKIAGIVGNTTWIGLKSLGYTDQGEMEFIMSLVGTNINSAPAVAKDSTSGDKKNAPATEPTTISHYEAPVVMDEISDIGNLFMCGTDGLNSTDEFTRKTCAAIFKTQASVPADNWMQCVDPEKCMTVTRTTSASVGNTGFLQIVHVTLLAGLSAVKEGHVIPKEVIQLANTAPFPLYQMLNMAAVYPSQAESLIDNSTYIISVLLAQAMFNRIVTQSARSIPAGDVSGVAANAAIAQKTREIISALQVSNEAELVKVSNWFSVQQGLMLQIKTVNQAIQTQVMSNGLSGSQWFSTGIMAGATHAVATAP